MRNLARGNPARWWRSRSCGSASRAPVALFISPFRRWSTTLFLLFILLFIAGTWYVTNSARLSRLSSALLSRVLGGEVTVRSTRLSLSGTLMLSGVEVRAADRAAEDVPIFTAQQIEARFDWFSLLTGQLSATQLVATTPVFQPVEDADTGHWNYERLHPGFGGGAQSTSKGLTLPVIVLRDAHVKWSELSQGRVHQTAETIINGEMTPDSSRNTTYHFRFVQANPNEGPSGVGGATFRGMWDSADSIFQSTTENVVLTETLRNSLPRVARQWCAEHQLAGRLSRLDMAFSPRTGLTVSVNLEGIGMMSMVEPEQGIGVAEERPAYPLSVQNVSGQIVFSRDQTVATQPATAAGINTVAYDPNIIRINDLHGAVLGYQFVLNGEIQGATRDAPFNFTLRFPDAVVGDRYPPLFMAFLSSQDLIQRMEPHGRMDILVNLRRDAPRGNVLYGGQIDLKDARLRYAHFPCPLEHVNGRLTFDHRSVTFHELTGKADQIDVGITGTCGTVWSNHLVDVTVTSPNMVLDDRIAACLPDQYQDVWNLFALRGKGKLVCRVTRGDSMLDRQKMTVDFDLADAGGYLRAMPYPFTQATGRLHIEDDQARIEHLTARTGADGSGRVTVDGVVRHEGEDVTALRPELRIVADVPIDDSLLHAFPDNLTSKLAGVTPGGRLGFEGTLRRGGDAHGMVQIAGDLTWKQGTLQMQFGQQPLALADINARAAITPTTLDLKDLTAALDVGTQKLQTQLSGKFDFANRFSGLLHLSLAGKSITLPEAAPPIFPQTWRDMWRENSPSGAADIAAEGTLRVNLPANPEAKQPALVLSDTLALDSYTARLNLHDVALKPPAWPDALTKIDGKIEIVPGVVSMTAMTAALGKVNFSWNGQADPSTGKISLTGQADTKGYSSTWTRYLPDTIANYLDQSRDDIALSLRLDSLTREAADKPWALEGKLQAANLAGTGPVPITIQQADFTCKALFDPKIPSLDFAGNMAASNLVVSGRHMDSFAARLTATALTHDISMTEIDGKVAGGTLQGNIRIRTQGQASATAPAATSTATAPLLTFPALATAPSTAPATAASLAELPPEIIGEGGYVANLVLHDADVSHLVLSDKATEEERQKVGTGRVTASLSLQQTFGPHSDRTGRGDLVIQDGEIYNVPLSMGLMQIATLRLPVARSFQVANSSYYLRNNDVTFERILLESHGINLAGMGTVSIDSRKIDMSFVTESQRETSIPLLTPVFDDLRRGLLELSVTGTVDNPKITPVPLSAISNFLRSLLPKPRASSN
jgi:hypothetical protein